MSNRIEAKFASLAQAGRKALITYIMAGDPDLAASETLLGGLPAAGADLIELGMPFSDPMADGPTIQAAGLRALEANTKLKDVIAMTARFRAKDAVTPIILMGYFNPVYIYGVERFCRDAVTAGVDGVILVDLPPEEEAEFTDFAEPHGLKLIRLATPTTGDDRLSAMSRMAGGFLYYVSVAGITGVKSADMDVLRVRLAHLRTQIKLPIAAGFGIRTPEQAAATAAHCDAIAVGTALVDCFHKNGRDAALRYVSELAQAIE
jgi:tryptophan synthase alpha chain